MRFSVPYPEKDRPDKMGYQIPHSQKSGQSLEHNGIHARAIVERVKQLV